MPVERVYCPQTCLYALVNWILTLLADPPSLPPKRGLFAVLTDPEFTAVARKAQGFTDAETAKEIGVAVSTVASYMKLGRKRMQLETTQDIVWAYYLEFAPNLLYPCNKGSAEASIS